jgi:lipase ATG15
VSWIQADSLADIAFYKQTSAFVKHMKESSQYDTLIITGHSLGGGLAMISGAQTEVPAIALSGPNAVISRRTFSPPVSIESLEKYTFNIVPDRDVVPRLDDLSQNYQRIKCRSGLNDPLACHSSKRSLCELLYQCGSKGRPIPCDCLDLESDYGNPQPVSSNSGGASMQDVCTA